MRLLTFLIHNKMTKIYIAGKVSGEEVHKVTMKFGKAQKELDKLGYEAVNPIEVVNDWHCSWDDAMKKCIAALQQCEAVYFLPCYKESKGAQIELNFAHNNNINVYTDFNQIPKIN